MKRLNERKEDYFKNFKKLKAKCTKPNFKPKLVKDQYDKNCRQNKNENVQNEEK